MLKLKYILVSILVFSCMLFCVSSTCYSVTVTDENLNEALQKFASSDVNTSKYEITVSDKIITITVDEKNYKINYDLTEKPTFSLEIPIEQGMSYDDFKEETDNMILPMLGYIAVANIQGVEIEDASTYFLMSYMSKALNGSWSSENSYIIYDDSNVSDGVTIDESSSNVIKSSEFGNRVMDYVNKVYEDKQTITDSSENDVNSYEFSVERKDVTDTSCKLISSLSVNMDYDFSKIVGYSKKVENPINDNNTIYENNVSDENNIKLDNDNNTNSNITTITTTPTTILPKTGIHKTIYLLIVIAFIVLITFKIKLKKYKDIK